MSISQELELRNMTRPEVDELVAWAAREGWNPGLHDADIFWATDPDAFIAADLNGEMVGGGAITSYGGEFGFMGFFIARAMVELRESKPVAAATSLRGALSHPAVPPWYARQHPVVRLLIEELESTSLPADEDQSALPLYYAN